MQGLYHNLTKRKSPPMELTEEQIKAIEQAGGPKWWDHTQPFPDSYRSGIQRADEGAETIWAHGYCAFIKSWYDAWVVTLEQWANGRDIYGESPGATSPAWLNAAFPELEELERAAEASFQTKQKDGSPSTTLQ